MIDCEFAMRIQKNIHFSKLDSEFQIDFSISGITTADGYLDKKHDSDIHQVYDFQTKKLQKMWGTVEFRSNMRLAFPNVIQWKIELSRE